jgi:hypothetical protein
MKERGSGKRCKGEFGFATRVRQYRKDGMYEAGKKDDKTHDGHERLVYYTLHLTHSTVKYERGRRRTSLHGGFTP